MAFHSSYGSPQVLEEASFPREVSTKNLGPLAARRRLRVQLFFCNGKVQLICLRFLKQEKEKVLLSVYLFKILEENSYMKIQ